MKKITLNDAAIEYIRRLGFSDVVLEVSVYTT